MAQFRYFADINGQAVELTRVRHNGGTTETLQVIYWEWTEDTPHVGARFWGAHSVENDGRIRDWPNIGLRPIGAATVAVTEGEGLDLFPANQPST